MYKALSPISPAFSIAAAFGNVHGVYKAGNVTLSPHLLKGHQEYAKQQLKCTEEKVTCNVTLDSINNPDSVSHCSW